MAHAIADVARALFTDRYQWPTVETKIVQYGGFSIGVELDMTDMRPKLVDSFIAQFRSPTVRMNKTTIEIRTRVGAIEVQIEIMVSPDYKKES